MFRYQFLTLMAFAAMLFPHAHAQSDAEPPALPVDTAGLLAFYGFGPDSMAAFPDQGLNGVMIGEAEAVEDRFGNANGALYFGPGERVDIPGAAGLNPLPFSVSLWFQPDLAQIPADRTVALFKKYYPTLWNGMMLWYRKQEQQDYLSAWYIRNNTNRIISQYGSPFFDYLEPEPGEDIWHHAVFTVDSVEGRIYVDGVLQDAQFWDGVAAAPTNNLPWQIGGKYEWGDTIGFVGRIDDVSVWQRALDESDVFALYAEDGWDAHGCADIEACNFEPFALVNDGTCIYPIIGEDCLDGATICADGTWWHPGEQRCYPHPCLDCPGDINDDAQVNVGDLLDLLGVFGSDCSFEGCTDENACNFNPMALVNDSSCVYVSEIFDCNYNCINDSDGDGVCDEQEIVGCQNPNACNYDPVATDDSGDCILPGTNECGCPVDCSGELLNEDNCECDDDIPGCTDQTACNFNPEATDEDGSCTFFTIDNCGCEFDCDGNILNDADGDGICDNADLTGCLDMTACNYDPNSCTDGFCIFGEETPGAPCDDGDPETHFDVYDENGCGCAGEPLVDPSGGGPCEGETAVTFGETTYGLVELGGHCWFRENLSTTSYANGDEIPVVEEAAAWAEAADGARAAYDNALETNGFLYNWMAVADARGVCPSGWQVPSDTMWMALESDLGLPSDQTQATGLRGTTEGAALKAAPPAWNGTDAAAFTGLPEGFRTNMGNFNNSGLLGYWWSTTPDAPNHAWYRALSEFNDQIYRNIFNRRAGLHIRCVKGEQPTVCNGTPGAPCDDGDPNTFNDVYDDMGCACLGTDAVELDGSGPCEGEASINYNGHDYLLVEIGDQCWFRENLQTLQYANGDSIPNLINGNFNRGQWVSESNEGGVMTSYNASFDNLDSLGGLYNHDVVTDDRGICPSGWEVPTKQEWLRLAYHLGLDSSTTIGVGWYGNTTAIGHAMKSQSFNNGPNTSGFTATPAGFISVTGNMRNLGQETTWWTKEKLGGAAWAFLLGEAPGVYHFLTDARTGNSVRCVKPIEVSSLTDGASCNDNDPYTFDDHWDVNLQSCVGVQSVNPDGNGPCFGSISVDYQGYDYPLIEIGDQCWFRENLRSTTFRNGDTIQGYFSESVSHGGWVEIKGQAAMSAFYGNEKNLAFFGGLYNQLAVQDERQICPEGWSIPSDDDWKLLNAFLGADSLAIQGTQPFGQDENLGGQYRAREFYEGTNTSGLTALAGGTISTSGYHVEFGSTALFWSSTSLGGSAWSYSVSQNNPNRISRKLISNESGGSLRCISNSSTIAASPGAPCDDNDLTTFNDTWDETATNCIGFPAVDPTGQGPCQGESMVQYQNHTYPLIEIEQQCWFRENLQAFEFRNGDEIPSVFPNVYAHGMWIEIAQGPALSHQAGSVDNVNYFGGLYSSAVIHDERGICPLGWSVPSDEDWTELTLAQGLNESDQFATGNLGSSQHLGQALRDMSFYNGQNSSGLSAIASGYISHNGYTRNLGFSAAFWSSTKLGGTSWTRMLNEHSPNAISRQLSDNRSGFSIRCLKESEVQEIFGEPCDDGNANTYNDVWSETENGCVGIQAVEIDGSGPCDGVTQINYDNTTYVLVEIGNQCWFRDNLATLHFANGDSIPQYFTGNYDHGSWINLTTAGPALSTLYGNVENLQYFGGIYNLAAALDDRGICPTGWRIPSDSDWLELEDYIGVDTLEAVQQSWYGETISAGHGLRHRSFFDGADQFGLGLLAGGQFTPSGQFNGIGKIGSYWTTSEATENQYWNRTVSEDYPLLVGRIANNPEAGLSVRCIKN